MRQFRKIVLFSFIITVIFQTKAFATEITYNVQNIRSTISLKTPGNPAIDYPVNFYPKTPDNQTFELRAKEIIPVSLQQKIEDKHGEKIITLIIKAQEDIYFNYSQTLNTGFAHDECLFYLPGFWYRRNLRSPENAPSLRAADSWTVREDRLSAPLSGIFNEKTGNYLTVIRIDDFKNEALTTHKEGEVILSGKTSIGSLGFKNNNGNAALSFGFPYYETPKSYIRKLTLAPSVKAFQYLKKGESLELVWRLNEGHIANYGDFITETWKYCYDVYAPEELSNTYSTGKMKETLSKYFLQSYVSDKELRYTSGAHIRVDNCKPSAIAEVGFIGRVLLNAFNALEYGEEQKNDLLAGQSRDIFDSYLKKGFTAAGFFREFVDFNNLDNEAILSIRRQSEGTYAMLLFLQYEKNKGRKHPEWEQKIKQILDMLLKLQKADGSFPRKFKDDFSLVDESGGSTPSATVPLVLGYKYFKDKRYIEGAKKSVNFLEKEIISQSDYFSSTLDANCEDKEASYYASVATYYLAMASKGKEKEHYISLCKQSAYFAASWYYVWDVPFAQGQMLGDIGFKTRGWGNVSVENNHIDVFIFELAHILNWLSKETGETRFASLSQVISSSMRQLLPHEGHLCGIAKTGYYPEVVQHTSWDYGKNGKGFYNDIFAPGWTVASLWELLSPGRVESLFEFGK